MIGATTEYKWIDVRTDDMSIHLIVTRRRNFKSKYEVIPASSRLHRKIRKFRTSATKAKKLEHKSKPLVTCF